MVASLKIYQEFENLGVACGSKSFENLIENKSRANTDGTNLTDINYKRVYHGCHQK